LAWLPISLTPIHYEANGAIASGFVLKAYQANTSTPISLATDSSGATQVASIALNSDGYAAVSGNLVIPHVEETFKLALYPDQASADANSGATWTVDGLTPISNVSFANSVKEETVTYALLAADKSKLIRFTGAGGVTLNLLAVAVAGDGFAFLVENDTSGAVTLDGDGAEQVNGVVTFVVPAGQSAIVVCDGTAWRAIGTLDDKTVDGQTLTGTVLPSPTITGTVAGGATYTGIVLTTPALGTPTSGVLTNCTAAGDAQPGVIEIATIAELEAGTDVGVAVTPGRQQFHPSATKAWVEFSVAGVIEDDYNVDSITDNAAGNWTVVLGTDFSSAGNANGAMGSAEGAGASNLAWGAVASVAGSFNVTARVEGGGLSDPDGESISAWAFGDQ
jgi:hypothetical protein